MKSKLAKRAGAGPVACVLAVIIAAMTGWNPARAANVMNYGADGNDYFKFTTPSMAFDKASGFTTLITFAMHVDTNGTLELGGGLVCSNGVYIGPVNWGTLITNLKTPPTTVTRYEVTIGGYEDTSWTGIENLIAAQGNGSTSTLYRNFQALKNAVPGIDAINDDDEETYDLSSSTSFANMLGGLGYKFTTGPYTDQSFWVNLNNAVTNCDYIYLQCYEGGAGNDPGQWNTAFGHGVKVVPGQESNTANPGAFQSWYQETGLQGGFFYPDIVFNSTYWSAIVYQSNGAVPAAPTNVAAVAGSGQISLSWNTDPGALSYNIKRSTVRGGETNVASVSVNNAWPSSNQYIDVGLTGNVTYYYQISGLNTNGEGASSMELSATPSVGTNYIAGVLALNPVGFWLLNETNGTIAHDDSGNNKNGLYHPGVRLGVAGVPNPPFAGFVNGGVAAGFGGSTNASSCVTLTNCPINSASVTITEWVYPTDAGALGTTFWNAGQNAGLSDAYNNNAALGYNWHGGDGNQYEFVGETPPVNQWSFVALVITPTNAVFYMCDTNSGLSSASNGDGNTAVNFTTGTSIGGPNNGSDTGLNGSLSGVAVFNYSLTPAQITQLFADGYSVSGPPAPAGLTATPGNAEVSLAWQFVAGATNYNVKRSTTSGGETTIASVSATNYTDTTVANGTTYYYEVSELNGGIESTNSSQVSATPGGQTNYIAAVLALNPVGYWPLNEASGSTAFDISGNGNNGTYQAGVTLGTAGVPDPPFTGFAANSLAAGFSTSASNSWVTLTNLPVNSANVTIMEWIYPTDPGDLGTTFWNDGENAGFSLAYFDNAALGYNWHGGDGLQWTYTAFTPPPNQWSFVALVITPTNAVFYMGNTNGLSSLTNDDDNTAINFTTGTTIGGDGNNDGTGFNGSLSDVAIFNYSLTPAKMTQLYLDANGGAPVILSQTASATNFAGSTLQLAVSVAGDSPYHYQWEAGAIGSGVYTNVINGGNISGTTNAELVITNATPANAADYIVAVSNSQGTVTSANPTTEGIVNLIVSGPSPSSLVLYPGGTVNLSASVIGPAPITCFWETNGIPFNISNSGNNSIGVTNTSSILDISPVGSSEANSYYFVATNVYGAVTSSPAILTVLPSPMMGSYAQAVLSDKPIAYWRFDELTGTNAYDCAGGHDAVYGAEAIYGLDGPCGPQWPGFETTNYAFEPLPGFAESTVIMPASVALDLNTNRVTMTAWVYFYEAGQNGGIVFQRSDGGVAGFGVGTNGDLEYNWNNDPITTNWDSGLDLPLTQWAFVAWVVTPTNSTFYLYSANGQGSATLNNAHANSPFSGQIGIGCDPQGGDGEPIFNGILDEVAIFDYSLSAAAISQLFTAASTAPLPPLVLAVSPVTKGQFTLQLNGTDGQSYVVEMSTNLTTGNWVPVYTNVQSGGVFTYTDTNMAEATRFYRVLQ